MNILNIIFDHAVQVIEAYIWYRLMTNMLELKYSRKVYAIAASLIFVLLLIKTLIFNQPIMEDLRVFGSFVIIVYTLLAAIILFQGTFFEKLIWWGIYYIGMIIMELVLIFFMTIILKIPMEEITNNEVINVTASIITKVITLLMFEFFISRRRAKLQIEPSRHRNISIIVVFNMILLLGCVIVFFNVDNTSIDLINIIQFFFAIVLIILVVTFFLVLKMERDTQKEMQMQLRLQQTELQLKLNKDMAQVTDNLRKLRHDMNNHIGLIKSLVYTEKYEDLRRYVDEVYHDVAVANEYIVAENQTLSVLLNSKKDRAKKLGIDFQSLVAIAEFKMQDADLCSLIGNVLDNAIEAADKSRQKKFIDFIIQKTDAGCVIQCENAVGEKPEVRKGRFLTKKENSNLHGIGIEAIKDIVAKYKGEVNFEFDDEAFQLRIVLPIG